VKDLTIKMRITSVLGAPFLIRVLLVASLFLP